MGMIDWVVIKNRSDFKCSDGHDLSTLDWHTNDLGCLLGDVIIDGPVLKYTALYKNEFPDKFTGTVQIGTECRFCPCLIDADGAIVNVAVDYELVIVDNMIQSVRRVSDDTCDWLNDESAMPYLKGGYGPMPLEEAVDKSFAIRFGVHRSMTIGRRHRRR